MLNSCCWRHGIVWWWKLPWRSLYMCIRHFVMIRAADSDNALLIKTPGGNWREQNSWLVHAMNAERTKQSSLQVWIFNINSDMITILTNQLLTSSVPSIWCSLSYLCLLHTSWFLSYFMIYIWVWKEREEVWNSFSSTNFYEKQQQQQQQKRTLL